MGLQLPNNTLFGLAIQQDDTSFSEHDKMAGGYEQRRTVDSDFSYFPLTEFGMGAVKNQDNLPPEIGGRALPTGAFVTGTWAEGNASMIARLDNRLGWVLLATMGDVSTISDVTIAQHLASTGTTAGTYTHAFRFYSSDQYFVPWLTLRRYLPHTTTADSLGEVYQDGKSRATTITGAAGAPVTCDMDLVARLPSGDSANPGTDFDYDPGWATATFDDFDDFAVTSCDGHFMVEDTEFKATNVAVTITNQPLAPAQSIHIGTTHPLDFPNLGRTCQVTATILVEDYNLYVSTFEGLANAGTDADVSCTVYKADLDVMFASQTYCDVATSEPFRLRFISNTAEDNVAWQVRPLRVRPNQPIVLQVTATLQATSTGYPLIAYLQNNQTGYIVP